MNIFAAVHKVGDFKHRIVKSGTAVGVSYTVGKGAVAHRGGSIINFGTVDIHGDSGFGNIERSGGESDQIVVADHTVAVGIGDGDAVGVKDVIIRQLNQM